MQDLSAVERMLAPTAEAMGYRLVRVRYFGGKRPRLQVMAERLDETAMTVDHCAELSGAISAILDVEDPVTGSYALEVSSPGLDRPLVRIEDYDRFAGLDARLETSEAIDGRKRFRGRLAGRSGPLIRVETESGTVELPFEAIAEAKLVVTDALIASSLKQGRA